jgi:site-specific DNA-methyltransferase (adenine-specific)
MLIQGDSQIVLRTMPNEGIDLVVTSPPYKDSDGYTEELMRDVFTETFRVQKDNTLLFLNFGHLAEDKFRPFRVCQILMEIGYSLNETIVWVKNHYKPIQGSRRLNNLTEFIFLMYKGKMPKLDRLAVGSPYEDKSNVGRYSDKDLKCSGNVFKINYPTIQKSAQRLHPYQFPVELPLRCIKLAGLTHGIVLDPFAGSGTVGKACEITENAFIGIELNDYQRTVN